MRPAPLPDHPVAPTASTAFLAATSRHSRRGSTRGCGRCPSTSCRCGWELGGRAPMLAGLGGRRGGEPPPVYLMQVGGGRGWRLPGGAWDAGGSRRGARAPPAAGEARAPPPPLPPGWHAQSDGGLTGVADFSGHKAILSGPAGERLPGCSVSLPGRVPWPREAWDWIVDWRRAGGRRAAQLCMQPEAGQQGLDRAACRATRRAGLDARGHSRSRPHLLGAGGYVGYATTTRWAAGPGSGGAGQDGGSAGGASAQGQGQGGASSAGAPRQLIGFDMGGTSTDVSRWVGGRVGGLMVGACLM